MLDDPIKQRKAIVIQHFDSMNDMHKPSCFQLICVSTLDSKKSFMGALYVVDVLWGRELSTFDLRLK